MKNTFIVNEDFLDSLSQKLFSIFGIDDFDYIREKTKRISRFPISFFNIIDEQYTLKAYTDEYTIQIDFKIFENNKNKKISCHHIYLKITNDYKNETYCLKTKYCLDFKSDFDEEEVIKYIIEIIQLYIDAVIEEKEEKQKEFKEKFHMEEI